MTSDERKAPEYVSVNCPTCGTRVTDRVREAAYHVKCPDCFEPVKIPSRRSVLKKLKEKERLKLKTEDVGTYGLSAVPERPEESSEFLVEEHAAAEPEYILLNCEMCNARLHPDVKDESYYLSCPDCHSDLRVPAEWEVPSKLKKKKKPEQADFDPGSYEMGESEEPVLPESDYYEKREAIRQVEIDPPPNWAFFSNVFEFPWMKGTLSRWVYMTVLIEAMGLMAALILDFSQGESGPNLLVIAFLVLPEIWFTIWASTYTAACFLPVVIDTASGNNTIYSWPEPNWREWMPQLFYVGYLGSIAALAGLAGLLCATIVGLSGGPFWLTVCIINFLIYPVMLLSSLEAGSAFIPLSLPILKCMLTHWWCWLLFYIELGILWGLWAGLLVIGIPHSPFLTVLFAGPMLAAIVLITARLLGRLAWRAGLTNVIEKDEEGEQQA
jgi:DNA-directed RNA polymerase subunit M/transcription elongation factor TFIIS